MIYSKYNIYACMKDRRIIYNTMNKHLLTIPDRLFPQDINGALKPMQELLRYFVVEDEQIEKNEVQYLMKSMVYQSTRLNITLMMTFDCNFRCIYCFERWFQDSSAQTVYLNADQVVEWIITLIKQYHFQQIDICFHGGEPLLEAEKVIWIANKLKQFFEPNHIFYLFTIVTNGYLLTPPCAHELTQAGVSIAQITVDGTAKIHNQRRPLRDGGETFDTIVDNIKHLKDFGMKCYLNIVYDSDNSNQIFSLIDYLNQHGFQEQIHLIILSAVKSSKSNSYIDNRQFDQLRDADFRIRLLAYILDRGFKVPFDLDYQLCTLKQKSSFVITPDGMLYKCISGVGMDAFKIGNLSRIKDPFGAQSVFIEGGSREKACLECPYMPVCNRFCKYEAVVESVPRLCKKAYWESFIPQYLQLLISDRKTGIQVNPGQYEWVVSYN